MFSRFAPLKLFKKTYPNTRSFPLTSIEIIRMFGSEPKRFFIKSLTSKFFRCALFLRVVVKISLGDKVTPSKFELERLVSINNEPLMDVLDTPVKSTPERFAFQKLVLYEITSDMSTPDKFECANDELDKSAPARLLFLILVKST